MGTTSDKLTYLNTTKEQLKTKINSLGGSITASTPFRDYVDALDDISGGGGYPPDWSLIGYSDTPQSVITDFNYAKEIYDNWDSSITSMANKYSYNNEIVLMPLVDTSNVTDMEYAFNYAVHFEYFPLLDTSKVTNFSYTFSNTDIRSIPLIDTSSAGSTRAMFSDCSKLTAVPLFNTSNATNMNQMFYGCSSLVTVPAFDTSKANNLNLCFGSCSQLSDESLNNIMRMCINTTTSYTRAKTLATIGITSTQATRCQSLSNYQDFLDAGWTTGY